MERQTASPTAGGGGGGSGQSSDLDVDEEEQVQTRHLYVWGVPALVALCALSVAVNGRVLVAVCWLRRALSPTLVLSLSLAAADAWASLLYGVQLVLHSLLPHAFHIQVTEHQSCVWMTLELLRLSAIIAGVLHLLALAANHHLGIRRPLRYACIMTRRNTAACILLLWLAPVAFFAAYFACVPGQGYQSDYCSDYSFLLRQRFRAVFALLFCAPLVAMLALYAHIFALVRRHQSRRALLAAAARGQPAPGGGSSLRAVRTTLLILGSFVVGWMPAVCVYALCCEDCALPFNRFPLFRRVLVNVVVNLLVICKTLLNPVIYAARMKDVKMAIHLMNMSLRQQCCPCLDHRSRDACSVCEMTHHQVRHRGSTVCHSLTATRRTRKDNDSSTIASPPVRPYSRSPLDHASSSTAMLPKSTLPRRHCPLEPHPRQL